MIKIVEMEKCHMDDIYGLAGCEIREFKGNIVSYPTKEALLEKLETSDETVFKKVLELKATEITPPLVIGYFYAKLDKVLCVAMIEQFYVHPDFRNNRKAYELLKEFEIWANSKMAKNCILGGGYGLDKRKAAKLGYTKEITLFVKEL